MVSYYGYKGWSSAVHALMCLEKSGMNAYYLGGISMDLIKELNKERLEAEVTPVKVGDTVRVHVKVKEGSRERI